jgi:hypothetical protein
MVLVNGIASHMVFVKIIVNIVIQKIMFVSCDYFICLLIKTSKKLL